MSDCLHSVRSNDRILQDYKRVRECIKAAGGYAEVSLSCIKCSIEVCPSERFYIIHGYVKAALRIMIIILIILFYCIYNLYHFPITVSVASCSISVFFVHKLDALLSPVLIMFSPVEPLLSRGSRTQQISQNKAAEGSAFGRARLTIIGLSLIAVIIWALLR